MSTVHEAFLRHLGISGNLIFIDIIVNDLGKWLKKPFYFNVNSGLENDNEWKKRKKIDQLSYLLLERDQYSK